MRFQRILEVVRFHPWFVTVEGYESVSQVLEMAIARPESFSQGAKSEGPFSFFVNDRPDVELDRDGIATIHVSGVLGQRLSMFEKACGNTGYEQIISEIEAATRRGASGFLFNIDSPGGMAVGCGSVAQAIAAITVPKIAYSDSLMCSAAYYIAAGCDHIMASESAIVGSIGTLIPWIDKSKMWELQGLEFDPVVSDGADLKATMHGPTLDGDHRAAAQQHVDDLASQFISFVSDHRDLDPEVWRAGVYIGDRAVDMNLVDDIGSMEDAKSWLMGQM